MRPELNCCGSHSKRNSCFVIWLLLSINLSVLGSIDELGGQDDDEQAASEV